MEVNKYTVAVDAAKSGTFISALEDQTVEVFCASKEMLLVRWRPVGASWC